MEETLTPLEQVIQKINEQYIGEFSEGDKVVITALHEKLRNNKKLQKSAQTDGRQIFEKNIFPQMFDEAAQEAAHHHQEPIGGGQEAGHGGGTLKAQVGDVEIELGGDADLDADIEEDGDHSEYGVAETPGAVLVYGSLALLCGLRYLDE